MTRLAIVALLFATAVPQPMNRIRFTVRCVEESTGAHRTLYEADVDGPPGTDFQLHMRDRGFALDASFVNEPAASGKLDIRASLTTRRRYGTSRAGLPLWEEDSQEHRFLAGFDQEIAILPFGGAGKGGLLKFVIVPERISGTGPPRIHINDIRTNGAITVDAVRVPHWYAVEAEVDEGSAVVARAQGRIFAGSRGTLVLPAAGNLTIVPRSVAHADPWRYTDVTLEGRAFPHGTRAVVCRSAWQSFPIDSKRSVRIRVAPEPTEAKEESCS